MKSDVHNWNEPKPTQGKPVFIAVQDKHDFAEASSEDGIVLAPAQHLWLNWFCLA